MKGQGSTEYLVILGAVLLVSLVTVNLLGGLPSGSSTTKEQQSKSYWSGTTPFAVTTAKISNSTIMLVVSNKLTERVYLTAIEVQDGFGNNGTIMTPNQVFNAGEESKLTNISFTALNPCNGKATGSSYEFKVVSFIYTQGSIAGIRQQSAQSLVGKCSAFSCGDSVSFTYNGARAVYGTVTSQAGKCWMDRNLGASQIATYYNDSSAYGDLFQWGRLDDSHQVRTSGTTGTLSTTDVPAHGNFIMAPSSPNDWRSGQNNNLWQGVSGINNPCPSGWRLPTSTEWIAEYTSGSWTDYNSAYASPLKLTAAGARSYADGTILGIGSGDFYWSSSNSSTYGTHIRVTSIAEMLNSNRAFGLSVRCIKD